MHTAEENKNGIKKVEERKREVMEEGVAELYVERRDCVLLYRRSRALTHTLVVNMVRF